MIDSIAGEADGPRPCICRTGRAMLCLAAALVAFGPAASAVAANESPSRGVSRRPHANRLARETSPYLLMHAHNPVDWYAWSPEVFETAKREGKPIFLSIGYSSCHWCHVMERLVFENADIARTLNENFINVKVDREERPDVDDVYMTAFLIYCQVIGSGEGGGWPLSMFLTPDGRPFAGGTYFPPKDTDGRMGFPTVLARVTELWRNKRDSVEKNADVLAGQVRRVTRPGLNLAPVKLERGLALAAAKKATESVDPQFGGFDFNPRQPNGPKFPMPPKMALLEYVVNHSTDERADAALRVTLDHIAAGGIRDHLAGGFHRYSTDRRWHIPHFEKMLYDQAQLAELYADAYRRTRQPAYRSVALETFDFVLGEMSEPDGGFLSAFDAEGEGGEGTFYAWTPADVDASLPREDARLFMRVYGFGEPQEFKPGYVLHRSDPLDSIAQELRVSTGELDTRLGAVRRKLLAKRRERPPVPRDDKILAAWNGLMIGALARGGALLKRDDYVEAAEKTATFVLARMRNREGELLRSYRSGQAKIPGYLEDYAYVTAGLLALYETTRDDKWLAAARQLCDRQVGLFWDDEAKGFYFTSRNHEALIARTRNAFDAVLPSGNAVSVRNLVRLSTYCREPRYRELARQTLDAFAPALAQAPASMPCLALALLEYLDRSATPAAGSSSEAETRGEADAIVQTGGQAPARTEKGRVKAKAYLSLNKLPPGGKCEIAIDMRIEPGWHINSHTTQEEWQKPTEVTVSTKLGTRLATISYPKGKLARIPGADQPVLVYENETAIRGVLDVPVEAAGRMEEFRIQIHYQACNDKECEQPATVKLVGPVAVAREGEPVKEANSNFFPRSR